jgi:predicted site-specific integrase-resolvase
LGADVLKLEQWARAVFGANAPKSIATLRRWARQGNIVPKPDKVGRDWLVKPEARYVNYNEQ